eukprot:m51a1_g8552 hypothetical protein (78) ;mRNA; f:118463-118815
MSRATGSPTWVLVEGMYLLAISAEAESRVVLLKITCSCICRDHALAVQLLHTAMELGHTRALVQLAHLHEAQDLPES